MKLLLVRNGAIAIASGSKVFIFKTHKNDSDHEIIDVDNNASTIIAISSSNGMSLIFIAYSNKIVYCWDTINKCVKSKTTLRKCPTAMEWSKFTITTNSIQKEKEVEVLILTDKSGDIIGVDVPMFTGQVLLGGHTASVITDLVIVNNKYLITADRDEKIRICQFPETDTITKFCLGHKSVITSMISFRIPITTAATISSSFLISSGWDNKIFLWNIESGQCIDTVTFENVEVIEPSSSSSSSTSTSVSTSASTLKVVSTDDTNTPIGTPDVVIETENNNSNHNNAVGDVDDSNKLSNEVANDDEDVDVFEKQYDESSAGNYPAKVAVFVCPISSTTSTSTSEGVAYVAVIFRNLAVLKIYPIISYSQESTVINTNDTINTNTKNNKSMTNDDNKNKFLKFGEPQIFTLSGVPVDISFLDANNVILILEKPMYIQIINIDTIAVVGSYQQQVADENRDYDDLVHVFQEYCKENEIEYTQQVVYSVDEHETGIRKHELDKPFNVLTGVNTTGNKGGKRSRKRNIQDVSGTSEGHSSSSSNSGGDVKENHSTSSS